MYYYGKVFSWYDYLFTHCLTNTLLLPYRCAKVDVERTPAMASCLAALREGGPRPKGVETGVWHKAEHNWELAAAKVEGGNPNPSLKPKPNLTLNPTPTPTLTLLPLP